MTEQIHGHQVMQMMIASNQTYTRKDLQIAIANRFGENARFYTCSAQNMTADELIEFLDRHGKLLWEPDGVRTDQSKICNH